MAEPRDDFRAPFGILAALTALRIAYLQYTPIGLYTDEAQYWLWAQSLDFGYFSKPPLIAWIVAATTGLCGNADACVRVASPLLHGLTAVVVALIGRELGGRRLAFWSAITYATLPGVFYSATLITTDVPLLLFWALLCLALLRVFATGAWAWAVAAGLAAGLGFLSKYAMLFALPGVAVFLAWSPDARTPRLLGQVAVAGTIAALVASPNIAWNLANGFATLRHTAELTLLERPPFGPLSLAEFLGNQVAIFGIVLTAALIWRLAAWRRAPADDRERLLLAMSIPVLLAILGQSLVSRAYGNWAAVAYVPLSVIVPAWLLRAGRVKWLGASLALHVGLALAGVAAVAGDAIWRESGGCGFAVLDRHLGWDRAGDDVARRVRARPGQRLLSDDREELAPLIHAALLASGQFAKWNPPGAPLDHYAWTAGLSFGDPGPWLLATTRGEPRDILDRFDTATRAGRLIIPLGVCRARTIAFYELGGFKGY